MQQTDHWGSKTLNFLRPHLEQTTELLQVATGYFSVQGSIASGTKIAREKISTEVSTVMVKKNVTKWKIPLKC